MSDVVHSSSYVPPDKRREPIILNDHLFQESFPALGRPEDGINSVGGSATVHAQQARLLNGKNIMVAPSEDPHGAMLKVDLPAATFPYIGISKYNQDDWYQPHHMEFIIEAFKGLTNSEDVIYSHMPVSGQAGMELKAARGNPHVYIGHAWELMSQKYFPERPLKEQRLLSEYLLLADADLIVTNTHFEASTVAKMYSVYPEHETLKNFISRAVPNLLSEDEILSKCKPNPLGIDIRRYNARVREMYRDNKRDEFLEKYEIPREALLIGSVGRIHPQKDPILAIEAFHEFYERVDKNLNPYLILAGPYPQSDQGEFAGYAMEVYEFLISQHKDIAEKVIFSGAARAEEINGILDIGLDTARFETWGLSCQERLAMGLPTVGLSNPVYKEIYEEKGVILADTKSEIVDALVRLANSEKERLEYSEICAKAGQFYSWERSVDNLKRDIFPQFNIKF